MTNPKLIWHAYTLGLLGADQAGHDRSSHGSLADIVTWLPHVKSVGAETVLLGPIFASLAHGYDTVTHREIDGRLGTVAQFDELILAAAEEGIGIVLDGAFAYVSRSFWRLNDPSESDDPWLAHDSDGSLVPWRGVDSLVTPDFDSIGYQTYVVDILSSWLHRGIAGWRLDSAWTVPAPFWRKVLFRVRQRHPEAWILGQVFDDDLPPVINRATYSSATEYALIYGTREWLVGGDAEAMAATLRLHAANSTRQPIHTFLGNHDYARLADVVPTDLLSAAFAILMTLPGIPGIYYGDETATTSTWGTSGTDAELRPPMSANDPADLTQPGSDLLLTIQQLGAL